MRAVLVPRREHASPGSGPVPAAGAAERLACVRLRLADGKLHAEACDGAELLVLVGEAPRCNWAALPVGGDLAGELHDDLYDINQRVLRLQAATPNPNPNPTLTPSLTLTLTRTLTLT